MLFISLVSYFTFFVHIGKNLLFKPSRLWYYVTVALQTNILGKHTNVLPYNCCLHFIGLNSVTRPYLTSKCARYIGIQYLYL